MSSASISVTWSRHANVPTAVTPWVPAVICMGALTSSNPSGVCAASCVSMSSRESPVTSVVVVPTGRIDGR